MNGPSKWLNALFMAVVLPYLISLPPDLFSSLTCYVYVPVYSLSGLLEMGIISGDIYQGEFHAGELPHSRSPTQDWLVLNFFWVIPTLNLKLNKVKVKQSSEIVFKASPGPVQI